MKVRLSFAEAGAYYGQKGLYVSQIDDGRYALSRSLNGEYGKMKSAFPDQESLKLAIPNVVDYLAGGSFIDPLRMMPTDLYAKDDELPLFDMEDLQAIEAWATVGRFYPDGQDIGLEHSSGSAFVLTKMRKAQQMLVISKWDQQKILHQTGITSEEDLRRMIRRKLSIKGGVEVMYFDLLTDSYNLKGVNCFVIPLSMIRENEVAKNWLEEYRWQKEHLIKYSEGEYRSFKRMRDLYARKILEVLPDRDGWPDNIENIYRDDRGGAKDQIVVEYITGACDKYRCDACGYDKVRRAYGK